MLPPLHAAHAQAVDIEFADAQPRDARVTHAQAIDDQHADTERRDRQSADGQRARRTRADGDRRRTAGRGGGMGWSWEEDSAACGAMAKQKFGSTHTDIKLAKLAAYLGAFNTALKNQPFERLYIDAFAGAGEIETAESDLPLIDGAEVDAL